MLPLAGPQPRRDGEDGLAHQRRIKANDMIIIIIIYIYI